MENEKINNTEDLEKNIKSLVKKQKDLVKINNVMAEINEASFDIDEFDKEHDRFERIRKYRIGLLISVALIVILSITFFLIPNEEDSAINPKSTVHFYVIGNLSDYSEKLDVLLNTDETYKAIITNGTIADTIITDDLSEIDINSYLGNGEINITSIKNIMNDLINQKYSEDHKYILIGSSKVEKPKESNQSLFDEDDFEKLKENEHEIYVIGTFEVGNFDDVIATSFEYYGINFQKIEIENEN